MHYNSLNGNDTHLGREQLEVSQPLSTPAKHTAMDEDNSSTTPAKHSHGWRQLKLKHNTCKTHSHGWRQFKHNTCKTHSHGWSQFKHKVSIYSQRFPSVQKKKRKKKSLRHWVHQSETREWEKNTTQFSIQFILTALWTFILCGASLLWLLTGS